MNLNKKKSALFILILAVFLFILDRFLKHLALNLGVIKVLLPDFLSFRFVPNYYIAFSIPISGVFLKILIVFIISALIGYTFKLFKESKYIEASFLTNIWIGAISNLLDRYNYGYVVDYIDLEYFTVFNVADVMIVGGAFAIIAMNFIKNK